MFVGEYTAGAESYYAPRVPTPSTSASDESASTIEDGARAE